MTELDLTAKCPNCGKRQDPTEAKQDPNVPYTFMICRYRCPLCAERFEMHHYSMREWRENMFKTLSSESTP